MIPTMEVHLPDTCDSGSKDGDETDVDCGGDCRRCPPNDRCETGNDCQSGICQDGFCSQAD